MIKKISVNGIEYEVPEEIENQWRIEAAKKYLELAYEYLEIKKKEKNEQD